MKRFHLVFPILITLVFAGVSPAQESVDPEPESLPTGAKNTIKIDEFGPTNDCDLGARVDNLFIQINNNPEAVGYVIGYAGTDFLPSQIGSLPVFKAIRMNLVFRRYNGERLVLIDGGFRNGQSVEFFLVPPGGEIPQPTDTVPAPETPKGTFLWGRSWLGGTEEMPDVLDQFVLPEVRARQAEADRAAELEAEREIPEDDGASDEPASKQAADSQADNPKAESVDAAAGRSATIIDIAGPLDGRNPLSPARSADQTPAAEPVTEEMDLGEPSVEERTPEEIEAERFSWADDKFGIEIARRKGSRGVIIVYADDQYYDIGRLLRFIEQGRDRIAAAAELRSNRIKVIFGGYRDGAEAEYYVVPKGGKPPKPKPAERPVEEPADAPDPTDDQQSEPVIDNRR